MLVKVSSFLLGELNGVIYVLTFVIATLIFILCMIPCVLVMYKEEIWEIIIKILNEKSNSKK